jgi:hypothetical protein
MRIRTGFVSNSSSASFAISISDLTEKQLLQFKKYPGSTRKFRDLEFLEDAKDWCINISVKHVVGFTYMDNFDIQAWFDKLEIPKTIVTWCGGESCDWKDKYEN